MIEKIIPLLQSIAISHKVWVGTADALRPLVADALPRVDAVELYRAMSDLETQRQLFLRDVVLFRGVDKRWRLIDAQPPSSRIQALKFLSTQTEGRTCAFCLLDDGDELRDFGTRRWIHPQCHLPYLRWHRAAYAKPRREKRAEWWITLGLPKPNVSRKQIESAFRKKSMRAHPDRGGSNELMTELNRAREEALATIQAQTS